MNTIAQPSSTAQPSTATEIANAGKTSTARTLVELRGVSKRFVKTLDLAEKAANLLGANVQEQVVRAVDKVDLTIAEGEVVGLVGESGCGKSTLGRIIAGILPQSEGTVAFRGRDVSALKGKDARDAALKIQMIFQDPYASLNPRMRVAEIIGEAPRHHGLVSAQGLDSYVEEVMLRVGLDPSFKRRYPHQFSGGQRQRIGIARALAVKPDFLVCDEAVAALDVSIQAQVLNLFMDLRSELGLTYLFISHDLAVVEAVSDRVMVLYFGSVVEIGRAERLFKTPRHPYTRLLADSAPAVGRPLRAPEQTDTELPDPRNPPPGCAFAGRCPRATALCRAETPALRQMGEDQLAACHHPLDL